MGMNRPGQSNQQVDQAKQMWANLTRGRQIALAAAVVGIIASFLPWYSVSVPGYSSSISGWAGWQGYLAILGFIVAAIVVLLPLFGRSVRGIISSLPPTLTDARLVMGAGIVALVGGLLYLTTTNNATSTAGLAGTGISAGPSIGLYIALVCAVAIAAGGYLMQSEPDLV